MAFKFNFKIDEDNLNEQTVTEEVPEEPELLELPCKRVTATQDHLDFLQSYGEKVTSVNAGNVCIQYINTNEVEKKLKQSSNAEVADVVGILKSHSDLKAGLYEGGLKIWECTADLLKYFSDNETDFRESTVLELGCGSGLLGIYALKLGAKMVCFQDYNKEVLDYFTIPNAILNKLSSLQTMFLSGDWRNVEEYLSSSLQQPYFDYIVTSETIYNTRNYEKLIKVFRTCLKKGGKVYVAAKFCYFGVGGTVEAFVKEISAFGDMKTEKYEAYSKGVKREILIISYE